MARVFDDRAGRLTIIDPNRPDNNISGGTRLIADIKKSFSLAHQALVQLLAAHERQSPQHPPRSFLECLVGGNFTMYETQREILYNLSAAALNGQPYSTSALPAPTVTKRDPIAHAPGPAKSKDASTTNPERELTMNANSGDSGSPEEKSPGSSKTLSKSQKRANRLKLLRPDLASSVGDSISANHALKLGGYSTTEKMTKDLLQRESALVNATRSGGKKQKQ